MTEPARADDVVAAARPAGAKQDVPSTPSLRGGSAAYRPASVLGLQRLAGNRSVSRMLALQRTSLQRAGKPTDLSAALATGESSELQPFRPFTGITPNQLLSLVNLIVTEVWVAPWEETMLEEAWTARGAGNLAQSDWTLWESCAKRGANIKNVPWLSELRSSFADKVYETAQTNLTHSNRDIEAEKAKLGIGVASPTADQDAAIKEQQRLAQKVKDATEALTKLTQIYVGYADPLPAKPASDNSQYGGDSRPGGKDDAGSRNRFNFSLERRPPYPPENGDGMPAWETISAVYQGLTVRVSNILNANPALYALVELDATTKPHASAVNVLTDPNQSPQEARQKLGAALKEVTDNITKALDDVTKRSIDFGSMTPVHQRLFDVDPVWSKPFQKALAMSHIKDDNAAAASGAMLVTLALAAAVEIGTAGAATPAIVALLATTGDAAVAVDSWRRWSQLDATAKAASSDKNALVTPQAADEAETEALTNSAMALFSVFGTLVHSAMDAAKVAELEARIAERQSLVTLATKTPEEQKALLSKVIERDGAQAALNDTGRPAADLIAIVGAESPAGKSLAALTGAGALTAEDITKGLPLLATKTAEEAKDLVGKGVEVLGPAQTVARGGGMGAIDAAVHGDAGVMGRLNAWRDQLIAKVEPLLDVAETAEQVRGFFADLASLPIDAIETALGIALTVSSMLDSGATSSVDGLCDGWVVDLDAAATNAAAANGITTADYDDQGHLPAQRFTAQRQVLRATTPVPLTERQLNMLSGQEFEELMRMLIGSGHFAADGLPPMAIMELKLNPSDHGLDGIGMRRRGPLVDTFKFEFKQIEKDGKPFLHDTNAGVQGGFGWTDEKMRVLLGSDDPVAMDTADALTRRLRRYFGPRYSESLLLDAFREQIKKAPLIIGTRMHADLSILLPQLRGLAKVLGKGKVKLLLVRGR